MDKTATPTAYEKTTVATTQLHTQQHVETMTTRDAIHYSMALTIVCFIPMGFIVGIDRSPGSFSIYGLSCFIWPIIACVGIGATVGWSLGFIFGAVSHASDPDPSPTKVEVPIHAARPRLTPHSGIR